MDSEQEIRLSFLEEAEEFFDRIESIIANLSLEGSDSEQLNAAMRSIHSVKGGAAMMGFSDLSKVSHCLEDFLKILRVRQDPSLLDKKIKSLLLAGVDCLREIGQLHQQGTPADATWLAKNADPIFAELHQRLGELAEDDEVALLALEERVDVAVVRFQGDVEDCLLHLEEQANCLDDLELRHELAATIEQLAVCGRRSHLNAFVELCQSVQDKLTGTAPEAIQPLVRQALTVWWRSRELVLLGRSERLPTSLESGLDLDRVSLQDDSSTGSGESKNNNDVLEDLPLTESQEAIAFFANEHRLTSKLTTKLEIDNGCETVESHSQAVTSSFESEASEENASDEEAPDKEAASDAEDTELEVDRRVLDLQKATENLLQQGVTIRAIPIPPKPAVGYIAPNLLISTAVEGSENPDSISALIPLQPGISPIDTEQPSPCNDPSEEQSSSQAGQNVERALIPISPAVPMGSTAMHPSKRLIGPTVRVSVHRLQEINTLCRKLILERHSLNHHLLQLQDFVHLQQERIRSMQKFTAQLRQWYDRGSVNEDLANTIAASGTVSGTGVATEPISLSRGSTATAEFDSLEMDRYTDLHLLTQEQLEIAVQLREIAADIELGLRGTHQVNRALDVTTRDLQNSITLAQMRPFSEVVGHFQRTVRTLSNTLDKSVELEVEGQDTLLDRRILELLKDPLNHLFRNAFDHGIEDPETRLGLGKPPTGKISIRVEHRGNQIFIYVSDDGRGLDLDKICARARQQGIPDYVVDRMNRQELIDLIFQPGFTTAGQVTELSGRGVGMDIVRTNLQEIRGDIHVHTQYGQGTTFTINLPFKLFILRAMVLESAGTVFAMPADSIRAVIPLEFNSIVKTDSHEHVNWQDSLLPLVRLEKWFVFQPHLNPFEMMGVPAIDRPTGAIVNRGDERQCLWIERFWDEQEMAIQPIVSPIVMPPGFIGSSVLSDGRVIPLVDPIRLLEWIQHHHAAGNQHLPIVGSRTDLPRLSTGDELLDNGTILIVDDSITVRRYMGMMLEKSGYQVVEARNGLEAVDKLLDGLSVQAVICDIEMPQLDGYGLLSEIKGREEFRHLPIAMLTSRSNAKHRELAMSLGASAYFAKPYNEQELLQMLRQLLNGENGN
jgi:chemosensory pili system protein ChpA (sensor histidine kinase/response regulator)